MVYLGVTVDGTCCVGMWDIVSHAHHVDVRRRGVPRTSTRYDVMSTGHDDLV